MSISNIIDPLTRKIYDSLIPQGGGIALTKGQLITADANNVEIALPVGADGTVLSCDSTQPDGLRYIAIPAAVVLAKAELISANAAGNTIVVPPPAVDNYALVSDATTTTGMVWKALGGSGVITTIAPLQDLEPVAGTNEISINFGAVVGEIPYGTGIAKTGTFTNVPAAGQILGVSAGVPAWINAGGSGTITASLPLVESNVGGASNIAINFTAVKGEMVAGGGVAGVGVIVPSPPANDYVLTSDNTTPSGLEWKAQGSGSAPIINRNDQDNTPLIIQKPGTANDTMVLVADRVLDNFNSQIYNQAGVGVQTGTPNIFKLFDFTPANTIAITSIVANVELNTSSILGTSSAISLCVFNDSTTALSSSSSTFITGNQLYNYSLFSPVYEVVGGTTYSFYVFIIQGQPGDTYFNFINTGTPVGNITVVGLEHPVNAEASFSFPTGKFRIPQSLTGFITANLLSYTSQSYVASGDTADWIQTGAPNPSVTYA